MRYDEILQAINAFLKRKRFKFKKQDREDLIQEILLYIIENHIENPTFKDFDRVFRRFKFRYLYRKRHEILESELSNEN